MTSFRFKRTAPKPVILTGPLGPSTSRFQSATDIGKALAGYNAGGELLYRLGRLGDEILGFLDSVNPETVNGGYSIGGILPEGFQEAVVGPNQGKLGTSQSFSGAITGTTTFTITGNTSTGIVQGDYVISDTWTNACLVTDVTAGQSNTVITLSAAQTNAASITLKFSHVVSTGNMKVGDLVVADTQVAVGVTPTRDWSKVAAYPNDFLSFGKSTELGFLDWSTAAPGTIPSVAPQPTGTVITAPTDAKLSTFWRVFAIGGNTGVTAGAAGDIVLLYHA